jgi:glutamate/tyrosine decarboxylase-like PLP-dependent enzyme
MDPVPLDKGTQAAADLYKVLGGVIRDAARAPDEVLGIYSSVIAPSIISADSPRFLGFIPAAPTKASLLFDMLISCASIQGISWLEASGAIAAENTVLRVIADEAGLPESAGGCFVSGGSAGNLSALAVARETTKGRLGDEAAGRRLRVVVGTDAHSSIVNTLRLLEMEALVVETPDHRLTADAVNAALDEDSDVGDVAAVVGTSGTTNGGIIDDLAGLAEIAKQRGWWFHVDGAYGGSGIFARSVRDRYAGIEQADSFILDPHKWLFTPFDLSAFYCRRMDVVRAAFSLVPEYLTTAEASDVQNLMDTGIQLGRRFRALKLWMVLRHFGAEGIRTRLAEHIRLARLFAAWVDSSADFERTAPAPFSVVCFRAKESDEFNARLLDRINASGEIFLSHTKLNERYTLRLAIGNLHTMERHVERAWTLIQELAGQLKLDAVAAGR